MAHVDDAVDEERHGAVERGEREQHAHGLPEAAGGGGGGGASSRGGSRPPARRRAGDHRTEAARWVSLGGAAAGVATDSEGRAEANPREPPLRTNYLI